MKSQITNQNTFTFLETGESVTAYISDTLDGFHWCLSLDHTETADTLQGKWYSHYEGICQIQSSVNPLVWYMYLTAYYDGGSKSLPVEQVLMVCDCNYPHNQNA